MSDKQTGADAIPNIETNLPKRPEIDKSLPKLPSQKEGQQFIDKRGIPDKGPER